jgi:hypothetical protein
VTKDPRIALRANPSAENTGDLEIEERKRQKWAKENKLRQHNFVTLVYLVAKAAVEQSLRDKGSCDELIEEGKNRANKRAQDHEEFRKRMKLVKDSKMDTS